MILNIAASMLTNVFVIVLHRYQLTKLCLQWAVFAVFKLYSKGMACFRSRLEVNEAETNAQLQPAV